MVAPGGTRLVDHWHAAARPARPFGASFRWDVVVLQDQSTLGVDRSPDGRPACVSTDAAFAPSADRVGAAGQASPAPCPVLYLTWGA